MGIKTCKPKYGTIYFYLSILGEICSKTWRDMDDDYRMYALGNCFFTEEEAIFAREKEKIIAALQRYAIKHNVDDIDWNNYEQKKWYFYCNHNQIYYDYSNDNKDYETVYFDTEETVQNAVEVIGEDKIKKYLFNIKED